MILDWPECRNARDLAGLTTMDGATIRAGALLRSDTHHWLTPATIDVVRDSGVSRIVDLRWAWECEQYPSPFRHDSVYRHSPLLADVLAYEPPPDSYAPIVDHNRTRIAAAFRCIAQARPGAVLVHCQSGRDRTGVLVALALAVAGVAHHDIASDYALSEGCTPTAMLNTLTHLDQRYGGAIAYLTGANVAAAWLHKVKVRLTG